MLRKTLVIIFTVIVIVIITAVVTPMFIPANKFRQTITEYAQQMLGHNIAIRGNIKFKAFPYIGIYMENVVIGSPATPKTPSLATLKSLNVEVAVMPLLHGNVVIKSLAVTEPNINLIVLADGQQNWLASYDKPVEKKPTDKPVPEKAKVSTLDIINNLMLDDVHMSGGNITYTDMIKKSSWAIKNANLALYLDNVDAPFEVKGDMEYNGNKIKLSGKLETIKTLLATGRAKGTLDIDSGYLQGKLSGNIDKSNFAGRTEITSKSLVKTMEWLTVKPMDASFSSEFPLSIASNTSCSPEECAFTKASFKLDSIQANGDVRVKWSGAVPAVDLKLDTNEIDFNLFKSTQKQAQDSWIGSAYAADAPGWSDDPINFAALRSIQMLGNINAQGLRMDRLKIGKTTFRFKIQNGRLSADILDADFYNGKANIFVNIDASSTTPAVEKRVTLSNVQMEPLLIDLEASDRFSGKANLQMNVVTAGKTQQQMVSNLNGSGTLRCEDGTIKGINIAEMVRNVQSAFKPVDKTSQKTDFTEMGGTFTITKGVVANSDMMMKAPLFRVTGAGTADLPSRTINYRLMPQLVETIQGQGGKEKQGIGVPVIIEGSFDNPRYRPDLEATVREAIKNPEKVKETIGTIKEQLKENKQGLKDLLKKF